MVSGMLCIVIAFGLLLLPIQWLFAMAVAAFFHELCHYWMVCLCGGQIHRFRFGLQGARMEVSGLTPCQELFCALAGPVGGVMLLLFSRWFPRVAICGLFQSVYNMIPVYPLDGGRVLRCGLAVIGISRWSDRISGIVEILCLSCLAVLGIYGCFVLRLGFTPLIMSVFMILRLKRPCKVVADSLQ